MKQCKVCKQRFEPRNSLQPVCSPKCAIEWVKTKDSEWHHRTAMRVETKEMKKKQRDKDKPYWTKRTQTEFNKWIRLVRDKDKPCISCGRIDPPSTRAGQFHAGHYLTVGAHPELRFHEDNVSKECLYCNTMDSEHQMKYRINLIERIGIKRVEFLEGPHKAKHYIIDELKAIHSDYQQRNKHDRS